jgi:hypothetical protein
MEETMRTSLRQGAFLLALLASVSFAAAQDKASDVGQNPGAQTPSGAIPPDNKNVLTNDPNRASNAKPFEAPGSSAHGGPSASKEGEALEPGGPPGATGQTMPSTRSAQNATEDKRITVEHALNLSDEQKQKISQMMAQQLSGSTSGSGSSESASEGLTIGNTIPASVTMHEFPQGVNDQMPEMNKYKYVQMPDRVLIVEPNNRIVVGMITR